MECLARLLREGENLLRMFKFLRHVVFHYHEHHRYRHREWLAVSCPQCDICDQDRAWYPKFPHNIQAYTQDCVSCVCNPGGFTATDSDNSYGLGV